jgi:hypothetical protein
MALRPTWLLSFTGQASMHKVQPVQSSGSYLDGVGHALAQVPEFFETECL